MRALTIRQPWAFAIAEGFKTVENRSRRTHHRGPILIHASQTPDDSVSIVRYSRNAAIRLGDLGGRGNLWDVRHRLPSKLFADPPASMALSAIVATAEITGCHQAADGCCAPWGFPDGWHWELANVRQLPRPVACRGRLGLWRPDETVLATVTDQLAPTTP